MKIIHTISELPHPKDKSVGFVPTMGGFHEGHLSLMRTAKAECDLAIASLFVNPTQFGAGEDFERYPRNLERDADLAAAAGVDILFAPSTEEMYPRRGSTIHVPAVTTLWEGASRPGHFEGVATIVCKLFNVVRPDIAYFGLKDLQQCLVIQRMTSDLNIPVKVSLQPTVREPDGLALSSRNMYLTESERHVAPELQRQLMECARKFSAPGISINVIGNALRHARSTLEGVGFRVDYFDLIDLTTTHAVHFPGPGSALIAAAYIGKTRLIDNIML
jgi:pantoate--beta-alanine ligase